MATHFLPQDDTDDSVPSSPPSLSSTSPSPSLPSHSPTQPTQPSPLPQVRTKYIWCIWCSNNFPSSSTRAPPPVEAPTTDRPGGICQRVMELKWQLRTTRFSFKDQYQPPRSPGRLASLFPLLISSFAKPPIKPILCRVISAGTSPLPSPCPWTPASTYIPSPKVSRTRGFLRTKLS